MKNAFLCILILLPEAQVSLVRLALLPTQKAVQEAEEEYVAFNLNGVPSEPLLSLGVSATSLSENPCRPEPRAIEQAIEIYGGSELKKRPPNLNQEHLLATASQSDPQPMKKIKAQSNQITSQDADLKYRHHNREASNFLDVDSLQSLDTGSSYFNNTPWNKTLNLACVPTEYLLPPPFLEPLIQNTPRKDTVNFVERIDRVASELPRKGIPLDLFPELLHTDKRAEGSRNAQISAHAELCIPPEAGSSRETGNDSKVAELDCDKNQECLWAFLYRAKLGTTGSLWRELMVEHEGKISSFIESLAVSANPYLMNPQENVIIKELSSPESINSVKEFAHLFWCINSSFLRLFQPEETVYISEQVEAQQWILDLFKDSEIKFQDPKAHLKVLLTRALSAKYSAPTHEVYFTRHGHFPDGMVCPNQVLMMQAAINILVCYYKTLHPYNWNALFPKDSDFIDALTRVLNREPALGLNIRSKKCLESMESRALFPWRDAEETNLVYNISNNKIPIYGRLGPKIEISSHEKDSLEASILRKGAISTKDDLQKMWALISLLRFDHKEGTEIKQLNPSYFSKVLSDLEIWRETNEAKLQELFEPQKELFTQRRFHNEVKSMLHFLWIMNSKFLEILDVNANAEIIFAEQKKLQEKFYQLITSMDDADSKKIYSQIPENSDKNYKQQKIIEALAYNFQKFVFMHKETGDKITSKEVMMAEASVEVLISNYWERNPSKFLEILQSEGSLVMILARIKRRMIYFKPKKRHWNVIQKISSFQLLPWGNFFISDENTHSIIMNEFHRRLKNDAHFKIEEIV